MNQYRGEGGPTAQTFLDFMQFLGKFDKIVCWCHPWRVGAPSYRESWICPWEPLKR